MNDQRRKEVTSAAAMIVVKVGTRVVTSASGHLDDGRIARLADQLNELVAGGRPGILLNPADRVHHGVTGFGLRITNARIALGVQEYCDPRGGHMRSLWIPGGPPAPPRDPLVAPRDPGEAPRKPQEAPRDPRERREAPRKTP